jgi:hypothetical protein
MTTQQIILALHKIENLSEEDKDIVLLAVEKLAFLQNKINNDRNR